MVSKPTDAAAKLLRCMSPEVADIVAKRFCASERGRLIQDMASMRNINPATRPLPKPIVASF
jgi:hypothetical protein